ncbi:MAG: hypothetical protein QM654_00475 [Dysgonamonadaceae bacterium]
MKKTITFILFSIALFVCSNGCHAQFLKKLGKSIEKVSKQVDDALKTDEPANTSSAEINHSKIAVSTPHRNLLVNLIGAEMSGDKYVLEFTITNKGENIKDYRLEDCSGLGCGDTEVYDNLGNKCRVDIAFGSRLPDNTPVKVRAIISQFSSKATYFSRIKIKGETWDHGYSNRPDGFFIFKNVPIIRQKEQEVVVPTKDVKNVQAAETKPATSNTPAATETQRAPVEADYTLSKEQMTGWKAERLLGRVQSVKYSTGKQVFFNTLGNPSKIINGKDVETRSYTTSNPVKNSDKLKLTYRKNTREIQDYYEIKEGCGHGESYTFNRQGKVISSWNKQGCSDIYNEKYIYNKTSDNFPSIIEGENFWESGSWTVTRTYQYLEFDKNGNWTKRKVKEVAISTDFETEKKTSETKNYIETAVYVYY